jgi:anti-sigma factor RsiW
MQATAWRRLNAGRDHRWARSHLSSYVEGELPPGEHRRLAAHERLCPECARMIGTLQALIAVLPSLGLPPDAAFGVAERTAECVRARIEEWG